MCNVSTYPRRTPVLKSPCYAEVQALPHRLVSQIPTTEFIYTVSSQTRSPFCFCGSRWQFSVLDAAFIIWQSYQQRPRAKQLLIPQPADNCIFCGGLSPDSQHRLQSVILCLIMNAETRFTGWLRTATPMKVLLVAVTETVKHTVWPWILDLNHQITHPTGFLWMYK